jgi:hypothetical protein
MYVLPEDNDDKYEGLYAELEQLFNHKGHMNISLGDTRTKLKGRKFFQNARLERESQGNGDGSGVSN